MIRLLVALLVLLCSATSVAAQPSPGHWQLVSGSIYDGACTPNSTCVIYTNPSTGRTIDDDFIPASGGYTSIISGSLNGHKATFTQPQMFGSGMIYDARRGTLVYPANGGHGLTVDNSVYGAHVLSSLGITGFTVSGDTAPAVTGSGLFDRWTNPTTNSVMVQSPTPVVQADGKPSTTHDYNGVQHMLGFNNEFDRYFWAGGNLYDQSPSTVTFEYDPHTKVWTQGPALPTNIYVNGSRIDTVWDPLFNRILAFGVELYKYVPHATNPASGVWSQIANDGLAATNSTGNHNATFDQRRVRMYLWGDIVGDLSGCATGNVFYFVFDPISGNPVANPVGGKAMRCATLDLSALPGAAFPTFTGSYTITRSAFFYDIIRDRIVLYLGGTVAAGDVRANIYYINPDTWKVTLETSIDVPSLSVSQGIFQGMRHIVSQDLYAFTHDLAEGVWLYKPSDQSNTLGMPSNVPKKWYGEGGSAGRYDHGNGASGGLAGGVSNTSGTQNKFERVVFDTTRKKMTVFGGNATYLSLQQTRGSNPVLQIDPATANATTSQIADPWTSLVQLCEGASRSQPQNPENPTMAYDGPQIGAPGPGRDLFYQLSGGYGIDPPNFYSGCDSAHRAGTALWGNAVLVPSTGFHDLTAAPYSWPTPAWGIGTDGNLTTGSSETFHKRTDSIYRLGPYGYSSFIERIINPGGTARFVGYYLGRWNHGNGETDLCLGDSGHPWCTAPSASAPAWGREHLALDPIGNMLYSVNWFLGKLVQFDIQKACALTDTVTLGVCQNDATNGTFITPSSSGVDYVKLFTIPGYVCPIQGCDGTSQHANIQFDQVSRRVVLFLETANSGAVYKILAFNPIDNSFQDIPVNTGDFTAGYLPGTYIWADAWAYDSARNYHVGIGGHPGSVFGNSPSWTPGSGPFTVANNTFSGAYDLSGLGGPSLDNVVFDPVTRTVYTRGTHYSATDDGTTTTFTNIGGMASPVTIAYAIGGIFHGINSSNPVNFVRFRLFAGPLIGNAPAGPSGPSISNLTPPTAVAGGPAFQLTVTGANFTASSVVNWDATPLSGTLFDSSAQLRVPIPSSLIVSAGPHVVTVTDGAATSGGRTFTVTLAPPSLSIVYSGLLRDKVGPGDTSLAPDGALDGTITATVSGLVGRTITALRLDSTAVGVWDTTAGTAFWVLGVALGLDSALLNNASTMAVNFAVADGGTFVCFASDAGGVEFLTGVMLTLTATLSDGTTKAATVTIGGVAVGATLTGKSSMSGAGSVR